MEKDSLRDPPRGEELNKEEIEKLEDNFQKVEIDGVTYYLVTM